MANKGQFQPGVPRHPAAGRKLGTPNKPRQELQAVMERMGVEPIEAMCLIVLDQVPCSTCRGAGITKYQPATASVLCVACMGVTPNCQSCGGTGRIKMGVDKLLERTCESCYGSGKEKISPELKGKMLTELAQYLYPKRKAIEVTVDVGGTIAEAMKRAAARVKELK